MLYKINPVNLKVILLVWWPTGYNNPPATTIDDNINTETSQGEFAVDKQQLLLDVISTTTKTTDFADFTKTNPLINTNSEPNIHEIRDFLARPIICPSGSVVWTNAQAQNTNLMTMSVPSAVITTGMWQEKIKGFMGFKGSLVMRIQANAQKFQGGILLISILPAAGHLSVLRNNMINSNIIYKSQLPSVRFNVAESDEALIKVPFISPELFYNRTIPIDWATVRVTVYSPSIGGDIPLTCWCHFEDVELFYPSAQASSLTKGKKRSNRRYTPGDDEDTSYSISTPLKTISSGISALGSNVPLLSSVSAPTAWFLNGLSKAFSAFGYSNVVDTSIRSSFVPRIGSHPNNCDVNDTVDSFALTAGNKIAVLPGFAGSDVDEMSIAYISSIPSYIYTSNWASASVAGSQLFRLSVTPFQATNLTVTPSVLPAINITIYPPCGYVANSFAYWRGSMVYRFYAAKTDFHVGRIMFVYEPTNSTVSPTPTFTDAVYSYKWVWDLRDSYSFEVVIPWVSSIPWRSDAMGPNGSLNAWVLNPLTAPATVTSSINILVEQSAGPDFEVAGPMESFIKSVPIVAYASEFKPLNTRKHKPFIGYEKVSLDQTKKDRENKKSKQKQRISALRKNKYSIYAHGPMEVDEGSRLHEQTNEQIGQHPLDLVGKNCLYTMGENIISIRQMMKRSNATYAITTPTTADKVFKAPIFFPLLPTAINAGARSDLSVNAYVDHYSRFTSLFALRRGGIIVRVIPLAQASTRLAAVLASEGSTVPIWQFDSSGTRFDDVGHCPDLIFSNNSVQGALDVHIPFWASTISLPVLQFAGLETTPVTDGRYYANNLSMRVFQQSTNATDTNGMYVTRQIADDFSLGGFIGVLPVTGTSRGFV